MDVELQKVIEKVSKLQALHRARERVRQLERELGGAPLRPEPPRYVPEYLRPRLPLRVARLVSDRAPLPPGPLDRSSAVAARPAPAKAG